MNSPAEEALRRAEFLVSTWHTTNKRFCGQGGGLEWQARKALVGEITQALTAPLAEIDQRREDVAALATLVDAAEMPPATAPKPKPKPKK